METKLDGTLNLGDIYVPHSRAYYSEANLQPNEKFQGRIVRIHKSQMEYSNLFSKLNCIIEQLKLKYPLEAMSPHAIPADDETTSNSTDRSSGVSMSCSFEVSVRKCNKRKLSQEGSSCDFIEVDAEDINEYPKYVSANSVIIGPNGTKVDARLFDEIVWISPAVATRSLLALTFTSDILATHTLTGKPSPAFYGRERPPKMQLDPKKTSDIVHCVRLKCGGHDRDVRSAITTKCADTAKKYKRHLQKTSKSENK